ncbi:hypothetical protein [Streptomyces sp. UH6]|uniref:hypothetical protein n=1 Tax=Streptomyces sp. UH6 TaxID=2748379 RepID=UPI0015D470ED|nr:hypothetical protein [Streptomyces sp. UH6]NYV74398.1 hypothetical protein [Streptomyces sp. UH6]
MPNLTGSPAPATIPHTAAEQTAMRRLFAHVGSPAEPGCLPCLEHIDGCDTGRGLRRAVSRATSNRAPQGV